MIKKKKVVFYRNSIIYLSICRRIVICVDRCIGTLFFCLSFFVLLDGNDNDDDDVEVCISFLDEKK